jgi:hypothetical protein
VGGISGPLPRRVSPVNQHAPRTGRLTSPSRSLAFPAGSRPWSTGRGLLLLLGRHLTWRPADATSSLCGGDRKASERVWDLRCGAAQVPANGLACRGELPCGHRGRCGERKDALPRHEVSAWPPSGRRTAENGKQNAQVDGERRKSVQNGEWRRRQARCGREPGGTRRWKVRLQAPKERGTALACTTVSSGSTGV